MFSSTRPLFATTALFLLTGAAFAGDADFQLVNRTGYQVDSVYVSATNTKSWGRDILGRDSLDDGESVTITFPHGTTTCRFDIKVAYHDGDTAVWNDVNLCQYEKITIHWDGHTTRAVGE